MLGWSPMEMVHGLVVRTVLMMRFLLLLLTQLRQDIVLLERP
jgi:hypothetical protein